MSTGGVIVESGEFAGVHFVKFVNYLEILNEFISMSCIILKQSHHCPCIGKRANLYRIDWQTVIKMRVTSLILALSLLCK